MTDAYNIPLPRQTHIMKHFSTSQPPTDSHRSILWETFLFLDQKYFFQADRNGFKESHTRMVVEVAWYVTIPLGIASQSQEHVGIFAQRIDS